jgi:hypothetical protein
MTPPSVKDITGQFSIGIDTFDDFDQCHHGGFIALSVYARDGKIRKNSCKINTQQRHFTL